MSREKLIVMAQRTIAHNKAGTADLTEGVTSIPAANYFDPDRWRREVDLLFKRVPLLIATSAEIPEPHAYKAIEVVGTPILLSRDGEGVIRAFVNMCSHRGAMLLDEGIGSARRFACPYHNWTYDQSGDLVGMFKQSEFGEVDMSCLGLTALPVVERAGLIWVTLSPRSTLDVEAFLAGYDELLAHCEFASMNHFGSRRLVGPNWKVSFDGYVDFYHLPILHKNTFGPDFPSEALFHRVGPHQRVTGPRQNWSKLESIPQEQWPDSLLTGGVWSIFPHASIAGFDVGEHKVYQVARIFPGDSADESITYLDFISTAPKTDEFVEIIEKQIAFLEHVVRDEDYATGLKIQRTVKTGAKTEFVFGRNEGGAQYVHGWIDAIIDTSDDELSELFRSGVDAGRLVNEWPQASS
ncbi:MAG: Rieske 2Fe-2S domain-containing protein [Actinomycetota bacterium]|nr:Rieske 2Fe-2S domain-containing protein [Actinomycetota bacterium]MDA2970595.1 Rieske 2Fe-2S domain-containing protein [Actinomycetota bacterium]MDA3000377.1 Rieske 2Fe-2S domain-containing protein [Actinomycetota bacterium]